MTSIEKDILCCLLRQDNLRLASNLAALKLKYEVLELEYRTVKSKNETMAKGLGLLEKPAKRQSMGLLGHINPREDNTPEDEPEPPTEFVCSSQDVQMPTGVDDVGLEADNLDLEQKRAEINENGRDGGRAE